MMTRCTLAAALIGFLLPPAAFATDAPRQDHRKLAALQAKVSDGRAEGKTSSTRPPVHKAGQSTSGQHAHGEMEFEVGEKAPKGSKLKQFYHGLDLPRLGESEGYLRADECVYRVDKSSRKILEIYPMSEIVLF